MLKLINGQCPDALEDIFSNFVDAIVTDPPYGISFMGKKWDYDVPSVDIWKECYRVLKPGGHLLAFAGTRTQHRMAVNIEDAGFEIRDMMAWIYGSGFPKSLDIGKAIDKQAGAMREIIGDKKVKGGWHHEHLQNDDGWQGTSQNITAAATENAKKWDGWGSALKPALEPITLARKPLSENTIADNVLKHGTGGINIDDCRVGNEEIKTNGGNKFKGDGIYNKYNTCEESIHKGRWPANLIHDGSPEVLEVFPDTGQPCGSAKITNHKDGMFGIGQPGQIYTNSDNGNNSAARFFYTAKASQSERNMGMKQFAKKKYSHDGREKPIENAYQRNNSEAQNSHPTIKPLKLMEYLCTLITPKGGIILDPFMGSGTTGMAAIMHNFGFIGVDREKEYIDIARARIEKAGEQLRFF